MRAKLMYVYLVYTHGSFADSIAAMLLYKWRLYTYLLYMYIYIHIYRRAMLMYVHTYTHSGYAAGYSGYHTVYIMAIYRPSIYVYIYT